MNADEFLKKLSDIADAMKANQGSFEGLKREDIVSDFKGLLDEQQKFLLENTPARQGEFAPEVNRAVEDYKGKYATELRDIVRHGEHKVGNYRQRSVDFLMAKLLIDKANQLKSQGVIFNGVEKVRPASEDLVNAVKAMTSTGSATGDELVPEGMASEIWQDAFVAARVAGDLPNQPMPTDPFDLSTFGRPTFRKGTQNTATTATDPATAGPKLTTTEMVAEVDWSYTLDEDEIIAMMPTVRGELSAGAGETMDAFVLNADATNASTGNINSDDADPADDSYYLSDGQDGIRHLFIVDNTAQGGSDINAALSDATLVAAIARLGKYAVTPTDCRIVPGVETYISMLGLTNIHTVDKYGSAATILSGELAKYQGIPVIPSAQFSTQANDGKYTTTSASSVSIEGSLAIYNRLMWKVGYRRGLLIEVDRLIQKRSLVMVASFRIAVGCRGTRSTATHTAGMFGLTV